MVLSGLQYFQNNTEEYCLILRANNPTLTRFNYLAGRSLKHVMSGKCIHTYGGWPGAGKEMVLWPGCDKPNLEIWFVKQGNYLNLVIQDALRLV